MDKTGVTTSLRRTLLGFLGLLVIGCATGPDEALELGWVCCPYGALQVSLPDTVDAGMPFAVTVETYGNGCVRKGGTEVIQDGVSVVMVPRDYKSLTPHVCDDGLVTFVHEAVLTFDDPREQTIIIRGRDETGVGQDYPMSVWVRE